MAPTAPASPPTPAPARGADATYGAGAAAQATTTAVTAVRYSHHLPPAVGKAYLNSAKVPLVRGEPLYVDVAAQSGLSWEILAACDWMQCKARPGHHQHQGGTHEHPGVIGRTPRIGNLAFQLRDTIIAD